MHSGPSRLALIFRVLPNETQAREPVRNRYSKYSGTRNICSIPLTEYFPFRQMAPILLKASVDAETRDSDAYRPQDSSRCILLKAFPGNSPPSNI